MLSEHIRLELFWNVVHGEKIFIGIKNALYLLHSRLNLHGCVMLTKITKSLAVGVLGLSLHSISHAVDSASFELATGSSVDAARVGLQWAMEHRWWQSNGTHIGAYWDLSLANWRGTRYRNVPGSTQNITDIGITPVFRFQRDDRLGLYAEAGIGAHLLSDLYDNDGRRFSTRFQFGDHLGVGYVFSNQWDVGLRIQHFSNASIKKPNPGLNFIGVRVSRRF
jgi:lipid A 3-O-deacylase